ncbi:MAG TPA: 30S ribosomal protein S4 [bacterium]
MARYRGPVCKTCRREGDKLFLKGNRCLSSKCSLEKKGYAPGQHGKTRRTKLSEYGMQLREKQKVKRYYHLLQAQFRETFQKANRSKGITSEILLKALESRLDNVVFRLGFTTSRLTARQMVRHRHFLVNGKLVDVPSYQLKSGDVIQVKEKSRKLALIHEAMQKVKEGKQLPWLQLDKANMRGTFLEVPARADIPVTFNEHLIVELYSK